MFDNQRSGDRVYGNQTDIISTASAIRGHRGIRIPGFPGCRSARGRDAAGAAGAAGAARAAAAGRAGPGIGGDRGGVRPAGPGARGRRLGGRGLVRDRRDARGRRAGRGRAGPRPGADPAGPGPGKRLGPGGGVAARRVRARPAATACASTGARIPRGSRGSGPAAAGGDAAARAGRAAGRRRRAGGAGSAPGPHPGMDRAGRRAWPAPGLLRAGDGGRPRRGGHTAYPLALAAGRRRPRHRSRAGRHPRAGPRTSTGERGMSAPGPRVMVLCCPGLSAPGREAARLFEQVLTAVTAFCPAVEAVEPGVCAFGARGPARYFGGETVLAAKIIAAVADVGAEGRIGIGAGRSAALLAARAARPVAARGGHPVTVVPPGGTAKFLAPQPVSVLVDQDQDENLAGLLHRLGLRTLGDLAALSAADVASRFGDAGEAAHRLARGGSRPLAVRPPDEDLSVAQEFDPPESRSEPVVFAAKALAERMLSGLTARGLTCVRVQVLARWADGRQSSRRWRHDGVLSAVQVADRVRWQLDGHQATYEPAAHEPPTHEPAANE